MNKANLEQNICVVHHRICLSIKTLYLFIMFNVLQCLSHNLPCSPCHAVHSFCPSPHFPHPIIPIALFSPNFVLLIVTFAAFITDFA